MWWEFLLRLFVASLLGAVIGLDREIRAKEAGFRTHFLVSLGSALIMIVSQYGFSEVLNNPNVSFDPSRVAAQVVSGIGFIGAGTIIIQKQFVRGLTTAAGLWATSGIGLAIGAGMYALGIGATILTLIGLEVLSFVFKSVSLHSVALSYSTDCEENLTIVTDYLREHQYRVSSYTAQKEKFGETTVFRVQLIAKTKHYGEEEDLFHYIQKLPNITLEKME
ncbi:MgtC/SapB family protein [Listeria costaricensis]|uniref:MgtC/SapB family protein n=1 Tax=Listeria costaricensis TaxID=2026604 RepID=UPI000C06DA95|nr:MgtC/SapB family protein [Listeria costaricensis]